MSNNLSVKYKIFKKTFFDINMELYHLYCDLSHECAMGRLSRSDLDWVFDVISELEVKCSDMEKL